jgi:hypothetical protein
MIQYLIGEGTLESLANLLFWVFNTINTLSLKEFIALLAWMVVPQCDVGRDGALLADIGSWLLRAGEG